jgi:DNA-binding CsgD family transcriptional regulator
MTTGYASLTDKEKETLRLLLRGHDAKSSARELGLSVHTVNERLRDARRKLGVTSSRAAARMVLNHEANTPENLVDEDLGEDSPALLPDQPPRRFTRTALIGGVLMSLFAVLLALSLPAGDNPQGDPPAQVASSDAEIDRAARAWLALVDAGEWDKSFAAAGASFRAPNTVAGWTAASRTARVPYGAVRSRAQVEVKYINAPPNGYRSVAYATAFADGRTVVETVTLEREPSGWRVVGYMIE